MALIHVIRAVPEVKGGPLEADIQEQDYPILNARGWRKAEEKITKPAKAEDVIAPSKPAEKPFEKSDKPTFKGGTK